MAAMSTTKTMARRPLRSCTNSEKWMEAPSALAGTTLHDAGKALGGKQATSQSTEGTPTWSNTPNDSRGRSTLS